ncbi:MAG TPA: Wzt carbohydrate-binding domain-containing protein, partial [Terriglobia bacterium]|nr:Wzt carbohydrate-binding domain-containing protein [Terriglobia bacterium]
AILGMGRREITRKFDEIVAFAEVEKFIDTPVKHYSSGMYIRLAFAVAAHLETDILFVDEVLSVGDVSFQKKCLGKMDDVAHQGRTVVFVSHNVNAVATLCRSAMLLADGKVVVYSQDVDDVLRRYASPTVAHTVDLSVHPNRGSGARVFEEICIRDEERGVTRCFAPGARALIELRLRPPSAVRGPIVSIGVTNCRGERVFAVGTNMGSGAIPLIEGSSTVQVRFVVPPLIPGEYRLDIGLYDRTGGPLDEIYGGASLEIVKDGYLPMVEAYNAGMGHLMVRSEWTCIRNA